MIKINLLEKRQKAAEQPAAAVPGAVKTGGSGGLSALGALLIAAGAVEYC